MAIEGNFPTHTSIPKLEPRDVGTPERTKQPVGDETPYETDCWNE